MSYVKTTDFAVKDNLPSGDPNKVARGTEVDVEFDNIQQAFADILVNTSLTGSTTIASLNVTNVTNLVISQGTY
jgi:hypothetical protein